MPPTNAEETTITEVIADRDADTIGRWRRVDPEDDLALFDNEVLVQWQDGDDRLAVYVERGEHSHGDNEGEAYYSTGVDAVGDGLSFSSKSLERRADTLETAMDAAIDYMGRTDPGVPLPTFSLSMEGGLLKPLAAYLDRLGGGNARIEVRDDGFYTESMAFTTGVDFFVPATDTEDYSVGGEGAFAVNNETLADALDPFKFGDEIGLSMDGDADEPRLDVGPRSIDVSHPLDYVEREFPEPEPPDFAFTADGLSFRDVERATRIAEFEHGALGVLDGVAFLQSQLDDGTEAFTARFDTSSVEGEGVVAVGLGPLREIRRAQPRLSQNDVTFTARFDAPLLVESTVGETNVDVRVVLADEAIPVDIDLPPAEIPTPDEVADEPDDEDAIDAFAEAAADEAIDAPTDAAIPESVGVFDLREATDERVYWSVDDGTGVEVVRRDGVWVAWARDDIGERTRIGAAPDREGAVALATDALEGYRDAREARGAARDPSAFEEGTFRRITGNDITGRPLDILADYFRTIDELRESSIAELEAIDGIGPKTLEALQANFDIDDEPSPVDIGDGEPTDTNLLELPIVPIRTTAGLKYAVDPDVGQVVMAVDDDIDRLVKAEIGPAGQFTEGQRIGTAFVTDVDPWQQRSLERVEIEDGPADGGEPEGDADADDERPLLQDSNFDNDWPNLSSVQTEYGIIRNISDRNWSAVEDAYEFDTVEELIRVMITPGDDYRVEENIQSVEGLGREMLTTWIQRNVYNSHDIAEPLAEAFDSPTKVVEALLSIDDYTDIPGIGSAGADELRSALADAGFYESGGRESPRGGESSTDHEAGLAEIADRADVEQAPTPSPPDDDGPGRGVPDGPPDDGGDDEPPTFTRGQAETIVEGATIGADVQIVGAGDNIREIRLPLRDDAPVTFTTQSERITTMAADTEAETILNAIGRWEEFVDIDDLTPEQVDDLNERREALTDQFDIDIPLLQTGPDEATTEEGVEEIISRSTAGVFVEATANADLDSLRITLSPEPGSSVEFDEDLREVQGQVSEPIEAVNEALEEWERAVDLGTVPRLEVSRQREALEDALDIDLIAVGEGRPSEQPEPRDIEVPEREAPFTPEDAPEFDFEATLTPDTVQRAFPRLFDSQGSVFAQAFDTLDDLVSAPVSDLLAVRGIGEGTIERMVDTLPVDPDRGVRDQRDRPLGIEQRRPAVTGRETPTGEEWIIERIEDGNRITQNSFLTTGVIELVFPARLADRVKDVVATNDIAPGGPRTMVQAPSFREDMPAVAADLKAVQFLLQDQAFADLRSSGYDIRAIMQELADAPVVALKSPRVRATVTFN